MQEDEARDDRLIKRAMAAYALRAGASFPVGESSVVTLQGRRSVVLRNGERVLAVYILENDGSLTDVAASR